MGILDYVLVKAIMEIHFWDRPFSESLVFGTFPCNPCTAARAPAADDLIAVPLFGPPINHSKTFSQVGGVSPV